MTPGRGNRGAQGVIGPPLALGGHLTLGCGLATSLCRCHCRLLLLAGPARARPTTQACADAGSTGGGGGGTSTPAPSLGHPTHPPRPCPLAVQGWQRAASAAAWQCSCILRGLCWPLCLCRCGGGPGQPSSSSSGGGDRAGGGGGQPTLSLAWRRQPIAGCALPWGPAWPGRSTSGHLQRCWLPHGWSPVWWPAPTSRLRRPDGSRVSLRGGRRDREIEDDNFAVWPRAQQAKAALGRLASSRAGAAASWPQAWNSVSPRPRSRG